MEKSNYYKSQLNRINYHSEYNPIIKIMGGDDNKQTNWFDLNKESANELINKLKHEFNL